jgi:hypothetical protein
LPPGSMSPLDAPDPVLSKLRSSLPFTSGAGHGPSHDKAEQEREERERPSGESFLSLSAAVSDRLRSLSSASTRGNCDELGTLAQAVDALTRRAQAIVSMQQRSLELLSQNNAMLVQALMRSQQAEMETTASQLRVFRSSKKIIAAEAMARDRDQLEQ